MKKQLLAFILTLCIVINVFTPTAFAADNSPLIDEVIAIGDIPNENTRVAYPPSSYRNLSAKPYGAKLEDLAAAKGSYTKFFFSTSTGEIHLDCNLERSGTTVQDGRVLEARLYKYETGQRVATRTFVFTGPTAHYTSFFSGLDVNSHYYIYFYNASSTDVASEKAISGTITVSESP